MLILILASLEVFIIFMYASQCISNDLCLNFFPFSFGMWMRWGVGLVCARACKISMPPSLFVPLDLLYQQPELQYHHFIGHEDSILTSF